MSVVTGEETVVNAVDESERELTYVEEEDGASEANCSDDVGVEVERLRRSTREHKLPDRYGFGQKMLRKMRWVVNWVKK